MSQTLSQATAAEIRAEMARRRISGAAVAAALDVSTAWVSYRINGKQEIGLDELERIAAVLGVPVGQLMPGVISTAA